MSISEEGAAAVTRERDNDQLAEGVSIIGTLSTVRRWIALGVLLAGILMGLIDASVANILVPAISESMNASASTLSWVVAGYTLAYGLALIPAGRLGDRYGHKLVFIVGLAAYVVTALTSALAVDDFQLILSRVAHGLAGGAVVAPVFALIQVLFAGRQRVRAFGFLLAATGVGTTLGPFVGAWIVDGFGNALGWRLALGVTVPIGLIALLFATRYVPRSITHVQGRFDWLGVLFLSLFCIGLLTPLIQSSSGTLPEWSTLSFGAAVLAAAAFALWERRLENNGGFPLLRFSLFRLPEFSLGLLATIFAFASFTASIFIALNTLWIWGREESAAAAALLTLPLSVGGIIGGLISDRFQALVGRRAVTVALVLLFVGTGSVWAMVAFVPGVQLLALVVPLLVAGTASGLFFGPNTASILARVKASDAGAAGGAAVTAQRVGGAIGAAVVFIVLAIRPGDGVGPFVAADWAATAINGVLACTLFAGAALLVSIVIDIVTRNETAVQAALQKKN